MQAQIPGIVYEADKRRLLNQPAPSSCHKQRHCLMRGRLCPVLTFAHINGMVPVFVWRVQKGDAIYSKWGFAYPPAHPVCPPTAHPWRRLGVAIERRELSDIRKEHACVRALMQYSLEVCELT